MSQNPSPNESTTEPNAELNTNQQPSAAETDETLPEIDQLKQEIEQLQKAQQAISDQYLRAKAEAENARRRAEEEISKARKFALKSFADSLLPVVDSLEAALALADPSASQLKEGSEATLRQLLSALERNKMVPIAPEAGTKFDPHLHQAISMVASDLPSNTVVTMLQKGYTISDRVLRPALVTVSAPQ